MIIAERKILWQKMAKWNAEFLLNATNWSKLMPNCYLFKFNLHAAILGTIDVFNIYSRCMASGLLDKLQNFVQCQYFKKKFIDLSYKPDEERSLKQAEKYKE